MEKDEGDSFNQFNYGVLFSKHYQNKKGNVLDVYVVYSDPSINEYYSLLKNPDLVEEVENYNIVKINEKYFALEKKSEDKIIYECNMLVNNKLLLNLVSDSVKELDLFNFFISKSNIDELVRYLELDVL